MSALPLAMSAKLYIYWLAQEYDITFHLNNNYLKFMQTFTNQSEIWEKTHASNYHKIF